MPTYELYITSDIVFGPGNTVSLVGGYDGSNDTILEIVDDDTTLEGDLFNNDDGNDPNQFGQATLANGGGTIGSLTPGSETTTYSEFQYTLTAPDGSQITLHVMEIDSDPNSTFGNGILVGYLPSEPLDPDTTYTWAATNTVPGNEPEYVDIDGAVCFTRGTMIETSNSKVPIEAVSTGDVIHTKDGQAIVRWIGSRVYSQTALSANPKLLPVRIVAGALGSGLPLRDLLVSRQHRMLVSSKIVERVCGTKEVLVSAIKLTEFPGIFVDESTSEVEYFHILFDRHEVIFSEGAPSESLYTGPEAIKALSKDAREEIFAIFPALADANYQPKPAREMPNGRTQKKIVARHLKNSRALAEPEHANSG